MSTVNSVSTVRSGERRRPLIAFLAVGTGCALLAACGGATTPSASHTGTDSNRPVSDVSTPTGEHLAASASTNKARTEAETRRLIALVTVPPKGIQSTSAPTGATGPAMGTPASASLVDTPRFWRVPISMQQSATWIAAHPPPGLTASGTAKEATGSVVTSIGYGYTDNQHSNAWQNAALDIGIAPDGALNSYWRADGVALWVDPTPATAPASGKRLAVTVAGGCPTSDRGAANVPPGTRTSLLPPGTPTAGLICSYHGLNGAAFVLRSHARLDATHAEGLAHQAKTINLSHTIGGVTSCPMDDGATTVIAFRYAGGAPATLWLKDNGCRSISNGTITASDDASLSTFATAVAALLPH